MLVTLEVSKLLRFRYVKELQSKNILDMSVTLEVSKLLTSRNLKELKPGIMEVSNIPDMLVTLEVSKLLVSIDIKEVQLKNILDILIALEVLRFSSPSILEQSVMFANKFSEFSGATTVPIIFIDLTEDL